MGYITPTLVSNWLAVSFMLPQLPRDIKWHLTLTFFSVLHFTIYISEMSFQDYDSDDFCVTMDEEGEEQGEVGEEQGEVEEDDDVDNENGSEPEGMDEATDNNNLEMPQRQIKKPAAVWNLAQRVEGGARCNLCEKTFKCDRGNTSNIMGHLRHKHRDRPEVQLFVKEQDAKKEKLKIKRLEKEKKTRSRGNQPLIRNFSVKRGIMDPLKKKKLDEALVRMTICMNRPFEDVENHHFRNVLFIAEPNYIVPSRRRHTFQFDEAALKVEDELKKDISKDVIEAGHKTINITSDHGTSSDQFRTKKNALTVARCDDSFVIKKDIVKMIQCEGSQTGERIRQDVKKWLVQGAGWEPGWTVNWVTDNEAKQVNARMPGKHPGVGLPTTYTGGCVDHTAELAIEETLQQCLPVKNAVHKVRSFVNHIKDSSLEKEKFHKLLIEAGVKTLTVIQGTDNRWFYKYSEAHRALILRDNIDAYFNQYDGDTIDPIDEDDWKLILAYENSLRTLVQAGKVLEGELFPTASSVIPFLDTVFADLTSLSAKMSGDGKRFVDLLSTNLKSNRRFPNGYKTTAPYNVLTLLDPRYSDLYFNSEEYKIAVTELVSSKVYDDELVRREGEDPVAAGGGTPPVDPQHGEVQGQARNQPGDSFSKRRDMLLAAKNVTLTAAPSSNLSLSERLSRELSKYLLLRGDLDTSANPCHWWMENHKLFPLLAKFWKANCAFPATSTSSERAFSMDGLIITPKRFVFIIIFCALIINSLG